MKWTNESTDHFDVDNAEWVKEWSEVWLTRLLLGAEIASSYMAEC